MIIDFNSAPYGTALTKRVHEGLPSIGLGNGTWILVCNTVTSYFKDLKTLFAFVASSVACALTIAAFIRDIPTIVTTVEQISFGAISIWTAQSRAAFLTHMVSYYLWPIGINLLRGFFLTVVGAIVVSFISIPARYYHNLSKYNAQKTLAIEHVRGIQLIASEILRLIPGQNPKTYLTKALETFGSEKRDKIQLFNKVWQRANGKCVEDITDYSCKRLKQAVEKQIRSLKPVAAYQKLEALFIGHEEQEERECSAQQESPSCLNVPINADIEQTLKASWKTGTAPTRCLELLIDVFKETKFQGGTLQLLTCLHKEEMHPMAFKVGALYRQLMTHEEGYEAAVKEMQNIYGFTKPPIKVDELWQQQH